MKYDLIITSVSNKHLRTVAKLISADPTISIQKANSMIENPPFVFKKELDEKSFKVNAEKLDALGVTFKKIESATPVDLLGDAKLSGEKSVTESPPSKQIQTQTQQLPKETATPIKPSKPIQCGLDSKKVKTDKDISNRNIKTKKKKKGNVFISIVATFGIILIIFFLLKIGGKKSEYKISSSGPTITKTSSPKPKKSKPKGGGFKIKIFSKSKKSNKKEQETAKNSAISKNYADSAANCEGEYDKMIKFYRIAISANEKNFNAWTGLVGAYRDAGMMTEAFETKTKMREIFGDDMFSIEDIVKPYGKLTSFKRDDAGVCRLEYRSQSKSRFKIEGEIYFIFRSLNSNLSCNEFSAYASTGKGKGLLVKCDIKPFPNRLSKFLELSVINFIE